MNTNEKNVVNSQEDEDGYILYPSCSLIEKEIHGNLNLLPPPGIPVENAGPVKVKKMTGSFALSAQAPND